MEQQEGTSQEITAEVSLTVEDITNLGHLFNDLDTEAWGREALSKVLEQVRSLRAT